MESRKITTYDEFLRLRVPWQELHDSTGGCLFQLHDWLSAWWKAYGASRSLSIQTFWNDALLVGVIPCFKETRRFGPVSFRRLSFLGEEEVYGEYSPLVESGSSEEVAQSAASVCANELRRGDVEVIDFHGFPPDSAFMGRFIDWLRVGMNVRHIPQNQPHFVVEGATSGDEYIKMMSYRRRRGLRRHQRMLKDAGGEIEMVTEWEDGQAFRDFVRLHTARWAHVGQPGRFGSARFTEFLRAVSEQLMAKGMARMYFVRFRGERICGLLSFRSCRRHYSYMIGRDPAHELSRLSLGEVLTMREVMDAFDEGSVTCDFMGGDYHHKRYTGVTTRWYSRATALAAGLRGAKGYIYWGGLAMRDALARVKRITVRSERDNLREQETP